MPILLFQGVIVTILSLVFVVAPNTSAAFAMLQDISIILYMCMYVCMFAVGDQAASLPARRRAADPDHGPPGRSPASASSRPLSAIVLGLTPPAGFSASPAGPYAAIIVVRRHRPRDPRPAPVPLPAPRVGQHRRGRGRRRVRGVVEPCTAVSEGNTAP